MANQKINVLYIGSLNRSGSTLLTKYFNEFEGFFSVNEIVFIGIHGLYNDFVLGNGEKFSQNAVWREIIEEAFGTPPDWRDLSFFENHLSKDLGLPTGYVVPKREGTARLTRYRENMAKLYQAIAKVTKCSVIVDSSKNPDYAYLLSTIENIDVHLLHLTRDFRGVYNSNKKRVKRQDLGTQDGKFAYMQQSQFFKFIMYSYITHLKFFLLKSKGIKYVRLRYEDFCNNPEAIVQEVCSFLKIDPPPPPMADKYQITLKEENLGIWGNPMRMENEIRIRADKQWRNNLPQSKKIALSLFLYPLLKLYNY